MRTTRQVLLRVVLPVLLGAAALQVAYAAEAWAPLVVGYLAAVVALALAPTPRLAFYGGLGLGFVVYAMQLRFLWPLFGPGALGLWLILALWVGLATLGGSLATRRWPRYGLLLLPVIWLAFEYARSELYPLRFTWASAGLALPHPRWIGLAQAGAYGISFLALMLLVAGVAAGRRAWSPAVVALGLFLMLTLGAWLRHTPHTIPGPRVVGIQMEFPLEDQLLKGLDRALAAHPEAELVVLSEYTLGGPPPPSLRAWCRRTGRYLVVGGKEPVPGRPTDFYNQAYVLGPTGETVHSQVKSVPIQFFNDGLPAPGQTLWESPWGRLGIAICYDLSYTRVVDRLVAQGAQALLVPTMDVQEWGLHEHALHAKVAPVRAREYGLPIFRVASSGTSQLVTARGTVVASAPSPGQGAMLAGQLQLADTPRRPLDRRLAWLALVIVAGAGLNLLWRRLRPVPRPA